MREITLVALLIGSVAFGASAALADTPATISAEEASAEAEAPKDPMTQDQARETLTDVLFSDSVERIDFQATTYEEGTALVATSTDRIMELGLPLLGDTNDVVNRGVEIIRGLNSATARGMYMTFGKNKQTVFVRDQREARQFGELVGATMAVIYEQYGPGISYQDKAGKLFHHVRVDPEDSASILDLCLETVEFVQGLPSRERAKYFR
jgi:hypothetical protein